MSSPTGIPLLFGNFVSRSISNNKTLEILKPNMEYVKNNYDLKSERTLHIEKILDYLKQHNTDYEIFYDYNYINTRNSENVYKLIILPLFIDDVKRDEDILPYIFKTSNHNTYCGYYKKYQEVLKSDHTLTGHSLGSPPEHPDEIKEVIHSFKSKYSARILDLRVKIKKACNDKKCSNKFFFTHEDYLKTIEENQHQTIYYIIDKIIDIINGRIHLVDKIKENTLNLSLKISPIERDGPMYIKKMVKSAKDYIKCTENIREIGLSQRNNHKSTENYEKQICNNKKRNELYMISLSTRNESMIRNLKQKLINTYNGRSSQLTGGGGSNEIVVGKDTETNIALRLMNKKYEIVSLSSQKCSIPFEKAFTSLDIDYYSKYFELYNRDNSSSGLKHSTINIYKIFRNLKNSQKFLERLSSNEIFANNLNEDAMVHWYKTPNCGLPVDIENNGRIHLRTGIYLNKIVSFVPPVLKELNDTCEILKTVKDKTITDFVSSIDDNFRILLYNISRKYVIAQDSRNKNYLSLNIKNKDKLSRQILVKLSPSLSGIRAIESYTYGNYRKTDYLEKYEQINLIKMELYNVRHYRITNTSGDIIVPYLKRVIIDRENLKPENLERIEDIKDISIDKIDLTSNYTEKEYGVLPTVDDFANYGIDITGQEYEGTIYNITLMGDEYYTKKPLIYFANFSDINTIEILEKIIILYNYRKMFPIGINKKSEQTTGVTIKKKGHESMRKGRMQTIGGGKKKKTRKNRRNKKHSLIKKTVRKLSKIKKKKLKLFNRYLKTIKKNIKSNYLKK